MKLNYLNSNGIPSYSNSVIAEAQSCARKYELKHLIKTSVDSYQPPTVEFAFGHAVASGIQFGLAGVPIETAIYEAFIQYDVDLDVQMDKKKIEFHHVIQAIRNFYKKHLDDLKSTYEVLDVIIDGQEIFGIETEFVIKGNNWWYQGHIDLVVRNKNTGKIEIWEIKTTNFNTIDPAIYGNADQTLGYSLVARVLSSKLNIPLDNITAVRYIVYKNYPQEFEFLPYTKTIAHQKRFFNDLKAKINIIAIMRDTNYFPCNGNSCFNYFRPCEYFERCHWDNKLFAHNTLDQFVESDAAKVFSITEEMVNETFVIE